MRKFENAEMAGRIKNGKYGTDGIYVFWGNAECGNGRVTPPSTPSFAFCEKQITAWPPPLNRAGVLWV